MKLTLVLIVTILGTLAKARDLSSNRSVLYNPRIVGGGEEGELIESYPHSAAVYIEGNYSCGGSIIHKKFILTAAQCVHGHSADKVTVVVGFKNPNTVETNDRKRVTNLIIPNGDYEWDPKEPMINDIALIELVDELDVDNNDKVKTIELDDGECKPNHSGTRGTVCGWGTTSDSSVSRSDDLMCVESTIITNKECKSYYNKIDDNHICLDGKYGKGPCTGDSGSALFSTDPDPSTRVQFGIVSLVNDWGCEWGFPTVYTRVACYKEWIEDEVEEDGSGGSIYAKFFSS